MRSAIFIFCSTLLASSTGCAAVLGLDSGNDISDVDAEAGTAPPEEDAASDAKVIGPDKDAGPKPPPPCAPNTADCNGNSSDGCETTLSTAQHCGACTTACTITQSCSNFKCCTNDGLLCSADQDCCSGKCNGHNCGH